jgi:hypothetical protein
MFKENEGYWLTNAVEATLSCCWRAAAGSYQDRFQQVVGPNREADVAGKGKGGFKIGDELGANMLIVLELGGLGSCLAGP